MAREMEFNPDFDNIVIEAILPSMRVISKSINKFIPKSEPPVDTGALVEASQSTVDDSTGDIEVGVIAGVVNPRTHQLVEDYAGYVIKGTSEQHANLYLHRATASALQEQRVRSER